MLIFQRCIPRAKSLLSLFLCKCVKFLLPDTLRTFDMQGKPAQQSMCSSLQSRLVKVSTLAFCFRATRMMSKSIPPRGYAIGDTPSPRGDKLHDSGPAQYS